MLAARTLAFGLAFVLAAAPAAADEGPAWCGARVATPAPDGLVVVDTVSGAVGRVRLPSGPTSIGWSPSCDRVAVVAGKTVAVVAIPSMKVTDLGAPPAPLDVSYPGGYGRTSFHPWPHASVAWSRSGAHFALRARGGNTREHDALVLYDAATGAAQPIALPGGEVDAFALVGETDVIAVVDTAPVSNGPREVVVASRAGSHRLAGPYPLAVLGQQDPPVVLALWPTHALVQVDAMTGAETVIGAGVRYLVGVSRDGSAALVYLDSGPGEYDYRAASLALPGGAIRAGGGSIDVTDADFAAWSRDAGFAVVSARDHDAPAIIQVAGAGASRTIYRPPAGVGVSWLSVSPDGDRVVFVEAHRVPEVPRKLGCDIYYVEEQRLGQLRLTGAPRYRELATLGWREHCGIE